MTETATATTTATKKTETIETKNDGLEIIEKSTHVLLIASHKEEYNTGDLVRKVAKALGCCAIINKSISRIDQDLNRIPATEVYNTFIPAIERVLNEEGPTKVFFIHGNCRCDLVCHFRNGRW